MGDNWRRTGTVLAAVQLDDGSLMVQVVMNNDMEPDSVFRVRDDAGSLSIKPLPYSLEEIKEKFPACGACALAGLPGRRIS